jgi:adenosine/AMP deaminase-like protein
VSAFAEALEAGDLAALRAVPKADLHTHGYLCANRAFVKARTGRDIAPLSRPIASMAEMHDWVDANIRPAFEGPQGRVLGQEAAFAQARFDGLSRIELGDDVWSSRRGVATADEIRRDQMAAHQAIAPDVEWIPQVSMSRHCAIASLDMWLSPYLELGFYKTLDLSGDETAQPIEAFVPLYRKAKAAGLRLKAHAGEWGTADDVRRAVELLELDEVQHGIAAADDPAVMRFLADNKIRLNVCPTSNLMLGRVESLAVHPMRKLFDAGVIVTVNTDDALIFGNGVSEEFLALYRAGLFTAEELDVIRCNGLID